MVQMTKVTKVFTYLCCNPDSFEQTVQSVTFCNRKGTLEFIPGMTLWLLPCMCVLECTQTHSDIRVCATNGLRKIVCIYTLGVSLTAGVFAVAVNAADIRGRSNQRLKAKCIKS
jgi:hypothetical protein